MFFLTCKQFFNLSFGCKIVKHLNKFLDGIITADINPIILSFLFSTLTDAKSKTRTKSISVLHRTPSFYPSIKDEEEDVNALLWASLISTDNDGNHGNPEGDCVNALLRASLISTFQPIDRQLFRGMVSMPFFGLLSFLLVLKSRNMVA